MNERLAAAIERMPTELGYKTLNRVWAKIEIFLGLIAVGIGIWAIVAWTNDGMALLGVGAFVLGGYLTLAGHRSHLYQSSNDRLAYLTLRLDQLEETLREQEKPNSP